MVIPHLFHIYSTFIPHLFHGIKGNKACPFAQFYSYGIKLNNFIPILFLFIPIYSMELASFLFHGIKLFLFLCIPHGISVIPWE
jgi:hypothetical protein